MAKVFTNDKQQELTEVKSNLPSTVKSQKGFEGGVDQDDLIIPRVKLLQPMSPEINNGGKVGDIVNSLTGEVLGAEFIPIFMYKNYIKFNPRDKKDPNFDSKHDPGALIWRTSDPTDPRVAETKFTENGDKPTAVSIINFFSYFPGQVMPIIVSFSKTSYKAGKQLLSLAKFSGGDMFSRKYKLTSKQESNGVATYWVYKIDPIGKANLDEIKLCEGLWNDFSSKTNKIAVHDEAETERPY